MGVVTSVEQIVSATDVADKPAIQTISPVLTSSTTIFFIPSNFKSFVNLPVSTIFPDKSMEWTLSLIFARHLIMQVLAWMWCIIFSLYFGSFVVFGITAAAHFLLIFGTFITAATFATAPKIVRSKFKNTD